MRDEKKPHVDRCSVVRFGELKSLSKRLAYGLVNRAKLTEDDVILVFSSNTLLYPAFVQATQAATICVSVSTFSYYGLKISAQQISQLANPGYSYDELVHHIKDSRPRVLVVGKSIFDVAKKAAVECGIDDYNIYIMEEDDHGEYKSIWSLAGKEELEPRHLSPQEANQRTAFMCYSSGTTGKAKGGITFFFALKSILPIYDIVETTHYNLTSAVMQQVAQEPDFDGDSARWLAILPLYHMYGAMFFIFLARKSSATL